jgi:hypothetical protein
MIKGPFIFTAVVSIFLLVFLMNGGAPLYYINTKLVGEMILNFGWIIKM